MNLRNLIDRMDAPKIEIDAEQEVRVRLGQCATPTALATVRASSASVSTGNKEERPNRRDPLDDVAHPPEEEYVFTEDRRLIFPNSEKYPEYYEAMRKSTELEVEWLQEDQRQLHRLVEVRPFMWT